MNQFIRPAPLRALTATVFGVLALAAATGAEAAERTLQSIEHVRLAGDQVLLTLVLSGPAPEPKTFTMDQPARLSLDLPGTDLGLSERYRRIGVGGIHAVALAEGADRTRVVVEMNRLVPYETEVVGNEVRVRLGIEQTGSRLSANARPDRPPTSVRGGEIDDIDFRRTEAGAGRVSVRVGKLSGPVDVSEESGRIVARFPGAELPESLVKRLDVIDFATPVKYVDAANARGHARITVVPIENADFDQVAYQTDKRFIVELQPIAETDTGRESAKPKYSGQRISLSFQNVELRALLQIIADVAEVNMVVSESVSGSMALQLENVPWDQALDIILSSEGLGMRRDDNVIMIAPITEIAERERAEAEAQKATHNLAPLASEIVQVNYAQADQMATLLQSGETSLLSERGQVTTDARTNTLLIRDTRERLDDIRRVIHQLDIPVRQVLIESRIVVANREFSRNLGVSANVTDNAAVESPSGNNWLVDSGFSVDLPVAAAAGSLTTSILADTFNLELALSALESENRGEVISSPRVITANSKEAKIEQGVEIPYLEAAASGAATVSFKEAVLSLTVTPQITPDERVIMDLFVTQDTQGDSINVQGGGTVPSINTRSLTTQVLVSNGETVVLGGIYEQEDLDRVTRVPVLGQVPLLGALFRTTTTTRDKRELLLFVTPKILKEGLALQ